VRVGGEEAGAAVVVLAVGREALASAAVAAALVVASCMSGRRDPVLAWVWGGRGLSTVVMMM